MASVDAGTDAGVDGGPDDAGLSDGGVCACDAGSGCGIYFHRDSDNDNWGTNGFRACGLSGMPPVGYVFDGGDCNDGNALVHPGATEIVADSIDQNCDGREVCYADGDLDLARTNAPVTTPVGGLCNVPGYRPLSAPNDCDDSNANVYPGRPEIVGDGADQNCDGRDDCFIDADLDLARSTASTTSTSLSCTAPGLRPATAPLDCCDSNANLKPNQSGWFTSPTTYCDGGSGYDYDCDGTEEPEYGGSAPSMACEPTPTCSQVAAGWMGPVPVCGDDAGVLRICNLTSCTNDDVPRTQACH